MLHLAQVSVGFHVDVKTLRCRERVVCWTGSADGHRLNLQISGDGTLQHTEKISRAAKILYMFLGLLCVAAGGIGIVLPLLPTTPLFLLASFLFVKSSPKLHRWLESTKAYQKTAGNFIANRGLSVRAKLSILIPVLIMLAFMFFSVESTALRILAVTLGTIKTIVFIRIKTICPPVSDKTLAKGENTAL